MRGKLIINDSYAYIYAHAGRDSSNNKYLRIFQNIFSLNKKTEAGEKSGVLESAAEKIGPKYQK